MSGGLKIQRYDFIYEFISYSSVIQKLKKALGTPKSDNNICLRLKCLKLFPSFDLSLSNFDFTQTQSHNLKSISVSDYCRPENKIDLRLILTDINIVSQSKCCCLRLDILKAQIREYSR